MIGRFSIRPEYVHDVLAMLGKAGINPLLVDDRDEGAVNIEIPELTDEQGLALAANFRPEWSAIIGIVGGPPFEMKR